ncbi:MAG: hypothetical protein LE169_04460 [Endomicrobium sp.]|nr:hypothetical protein [Endomicrobium sp.]
MGLYAMEGKGKKMETKLLVLQEALRLIVPLLEKMTKGTGDLTHVKVDQLIDILDAIDRGELSAEKAIENAKEVIK